MVRRRPWWQSRVAWFGATAAAALALGATVAAWPAPDFGTVPAWVSAGGAVATFVSVAVAVQSFRRQQRSELEDQAAQVRLVELRIRRGETDLFDGNPFWKVYVENRSREPVHDVVVEDVYARFGPGSRTWVRLRPMRIEAQLGPPEVVSGPRSAREIPPGETFDCQWTVEADWRPELRPPGAGIRVRVTDHSGRVWRLADDFEPEKITRERQRLKLAK